MVKHTTVPLLRRLGGITGCQFEASLGYTGLLGLVIYCLKKPKTQRTKNTQYLMVLVIQFVSL